MACKNLNRPLDHHPSRGAVVTVTDIIFQQTPALQKEFDNGLTDLCRHWLWEGAIPADKGDVYALGITMCTMATMMGRSYPFLLQGLWPMIWRMLDPNPLTRMTPDEMLPMYMDFLRSADLIKKSDSMVVGTVPKDHSSQ
jgi:hypothetical protein